MEKSKYTIGPWIVCGDGKTIRAYKHIMENYRRNIAMAGKLDNPDEMAGNAALISAAPDLLAACEAVAALMDGQGRRNLPEVAGMARAAIKKARGEL